MSDNLIETIDRIASKLRHLDGNELKMLRAEISFLVAEAVAAEREAIAKMIFDDRFFGHGEDADPIFCRELARDIRARGETKK